MIEIHFDERVKIDVYKRQVYRQFKDINTFMSELNKLLNEK